MTRSANDILISNARKQTLNIWCYLWLRCVVALANRVSVSSQKNHSAEGGIVRYTGLCSAGIPSFRRPQFRSILVPRLEKGTEFHVTRWKDKVEQNSNGFPFPSGCKVFFMGGAFVKFDWIEFS